MGASGNDVSLDRQMRMLGESVMRFDLATMLVRGNVGAVRSAIQEGRNG